MNLDFSGTKIMVVGEVGIDIYLEGTSTRMSPEAPVPVVSEIKNSKYPGMAANLAEQVRALGAEAVLYTVLGIDRDSQTLFDLTNAEKLCYVLDADRPTTTKTRLISNQKQLARIDNESTAELSANVEASFMELVCNAMGQYDAVFLQDYGKGIWSINSLRTVLNHAQKLGKRVFVDPYRERPVWVYAGAYVLKPNRLEAQRLAGANSHVTTSLPRMIHQKVDVEIVVVTLGKAGSVTKQKNGRVLTIESVPVDVVDVTGAGDTFMAVLGLCLLQQPRQPFNDCVRIAHVAAGLAVQKQRTAVVTIQELNDSLLVGSTYPKESYDR